MTQDPSLIVDSMHPAKRVVGGIVALVAFSVMLIGLALPAVLFLAVVFVIGLSLAGMSWRWERCRHPRCVKRTIAVWGIIIGELEVAGSDVEELKIRFESTGSGNKRSSGYSVIIRTNNGSHSPLNMLDAYHRAYLNGLEFARTLETDLVDTVTNRVLARDALDTPLLERLKKVPEVPDTSPNNRFRLSTSGTGTTVVVIPPAGGVLPWLFALGVLPCIFAVGLLLVIVCPVQIVQTMNDSAAPEGSVAAAIMGMVFGLGLVTLGVHQSGRALRPVMETITLEASTDTLSLSLTGVIKQRIIWPVEDLRMVDVVAADHLESTSHAILVVASHDQNATLGHGYPTEDLRWLEQVIKRALS